MAVFDRLASVFTTPVDPGRFARSVLGRDRGPAAPRSGHAEPERSATGHRLRFATSGVELSRPPLGGNADMSILELAESAGLKPRFGCRKGRCHSCAVTLLAGAVRDLRSGAVTSPVGGRVQICINAPYGDCEVQL